MALTTEEKLVIAISFLREIAEIHTSWFDEYGNKVHDFNCAACKANSALYQMKEDENYMGVNQAGN